MSFFSKVNNALFPCAKEYAPLGPAKTFTLGLQHAFAMCCATILVPLLTGLDVGVALMAAGCGTLIFHLCTKGRMPTFLGSSFAFIPAMMAIIGNEAFGATKDEQIAAAMGGIIAAGLVYVVLAAIVRFAGKKFIEKLFPPVVRGVGITIIGLNLAGTAVSGIQPSDANGVVFGAAYAWCWIIAGIVCLTAILLSSYGKGMFKQSSIVIALLTGYVITIVLDLVGILPEGILNLAPVASSQWFTQPHFVLPRLDWRAVSLVAPIAIVTCVEHVGDVYANGAVVGKDFADNPGLHRTLLGDGLATVFAGCIGGPANTTYSENTAVLAATGNYNPASLRMAALIAIVVSFLGKAMAAVNTMPSCVLNGACIVLYGMIASVGLRTLVENHVDFTKNRNLCIAAVMLVLAIGGAVIGTADFSFSGIGLGIIVGIILNLLLPEPKDDKPALVAHTVKSNEIIAERKDD